MVQRAMAAGLIRSCHRLLQCSLVKLNLTGLIIRNGPPGLSDGGHTSNDPEEKGGGACSVI